MDEKQFDFLPIKRKVDCPIIDIHTHTRELDGYDEYIRSMDLFCIARAVVIAPREIAWDLKRAHPYRVEIAVTTPSHLLENPDLLAREGPKAVEDAVDNGCRIWKFWFAPRSRLIWKVHFGDARFIPMMEVMEKHNMAAIIHVSDPDIWFETRYADASVYGTKADQYVPLEDVLERHRGINFIGAHMAGYPEQLDFVGELLDRHPNYYVDTSATKWIVREISRQADEARAFFEKYRDRILFGTDNFVMPDRDTHLYNTRYWAHQLLWESDMDVESPIHDDDYGGKPVIRGINLPPDLLEDIYLNNACRLLPELFLDLMPK